MNTGTVPLAWKWSNVTPVYKGGDTENPGNFHPISVVTVVAKVLEKMIADQLGLFLESQYDSQKIDLIGQQSFSPELWLSKNRPIIGQQSFSPGLLLQL